MKKFFVTALATIMVTGPMLTAQAAPMVPMVKSEAQTHEVQYRPGKVEKRTVIKRGPHGKIVKREVTKKRWVRGQRMNDWRRYREVDYRRNHLKAPPRGYRWVRADNDYVLIAIGSGLIASIIAGR